MDFEKKYPITQFPSEFVLVQWTRGYKEVAVYYKEQEVAYVKGTKNLLNGTTISTEQLGIIRLKLSEKPVILDVIIDGFHSPVNVSHPVKELKSLATYFWILVALSFIVGATEMISLSEIPALLAIGIGINAFVLSIYIISAVFISKSKTWAYYLGFSTFCFFTLLYLLLGLIGASSGIYFFIFTTIRIGGVVLFSVNMRTVISASKHLRYGIHHSDDLLDAKV